MKNQPTSVEQDTAAGGRENRLVRLPDGRTATASVEIKQFKEGGSCWAYLRWNSDRHTTNLYVGSVAGRDRETQLRDAWRQVREKGMIKPGKGARRGGQARRSR